MPWYYFLIVAAILLAVYLLLFTGITSRLGFGKSGTGTTTYERIRAFDWAWAVVLALACLSIPPFLGGLLILMAEDALAGIWLIALGIILISGSLMIFFGSLGDIPTVSKGILTVWGKRVPVVVDEGVRFLPNYFPFYRGAKIIKTETVNKDFIVKQIPTNKNGKGPLNEPVVRIRTVRKRNGSGTSDPSSAEPKPELDFDFETTLEAKVSITYTPDTKDNNRLIAYDDVGGAEGVVRNLEDTGLTGNYLRILGTFNTAKKMVSSRNELVLWMIKYLTGKFPGENGMPGSPEQPEEFFNEMRRTDGFPDCHGLGIRILRFDIAEIYPEDPEVRKIIQGQFVEAYERKKETADTTTQVKLAQQMQKIMAEPNGKEAVHASQVSSGRRSGTDNVLRLEGNEAGANVGILLAALAPALERLGVQLPKNSDQGSGGKGGNKPTK